MYLTRSHACGTYILVRLAFRLGSWTPSINQSINRLSVSGSRKAGLD